MKTHDYTEDIFYQLQNQMTAMLFHMYSRQVIGAKSQPWVHNKQISRLKASYLGLSKVQQNHVNPAKTIYSCKRVNGKCQMCNSQLLLGIFFFHWGLLCWAINSSWRTKSQVNSVRFNQLNPKNVLGNVSLKQIKRLYPKDQKSLENLLLFPGNDQRKVVNVPYSLNEL